jgi:hypothetical protein
MLHFPCAHDVQRVNDGLQRPMQANEGPTKDNAGPQGVFGGNYGGTNDATRRLCPGMFYFFVSILLLIIHRMILLLGLLSQPKAVASRRGLMKVDDSQLGPSQANNDQREPTKASKVDDSQREPTQVDNDQRELTHIDDDQPQPPSHVDSVSFFFDNTTASLPPQQLANESR